MEKKMTIRKVSLNGIEDVKQFVRIMGACPHPTVVKADKYIVDAKSIMGMFSLNLLEPVKLEIEADETEVKETLDAIQSFIVK